MKKLLVHKEFFFITAILFIAAFLRFYRIADYLTFLGDEGRDSLVVYNILHGKLTLLGPTASVGGFFLGPIYYYLIAPFLWLFNYNPVGPAVMVALIGVITVWFIYKVGVEFFGRGVGILASFLYAISPGVVAYTRSSWNPNPIPFFSLLVFYMLYKATIKKQNFLFVAVGILLGILMQLHYLSTFTGVIVALYVVLVQKLWINKKIVTSLLIIIKQYIYILIGFIIGWSPFLAFEIRHGFQNIKSITTFIFHSGETGGNGQFFPILTDVFIRLFGRLLVQLPDTGKIIFPHQPIQINFLIANLTIPFLVFYILTIIIAVVSIALFCYQWLKAFKEKRKIWYWQTLLLLWFTIGIFLFGFYKKPIYDYYFTFLFPLPFFFTANAFFILWEKTKIYKMIGVFFLFCIILLSIERTPIQYAPNRQLDQTIQIASFINNKAEKPPFNLALITGGNSDHAYRYFFTVWNHPPVIIQNPQIDPERKSVTDQLFVICESLPCNPLGHSLWEIAGFGQADIAGEWNVSVVKIYKLIHYKSN